MPTPKIEIIVNENKKARPATKIAVKTSLQRIGVVYSVEAKELTTREDHVITGRYRASIGAKGKRDGIFRQKSYNRIEVGTNVFYSEHLEIGIHYL